MSILLFDHTRIPPPSPSLSHPASIHTAEPPPVCVRLIADSADRYAPLSIDLHTIIAILSLFIWSSSVTAGTCIYPLSTFGPMAMYGSDFRAVGGIDDGNSGRWGYEDTAFAHKVGWISVRSWKAFFVGMTPAVPRSQR